MSRSRSTSIGRSPRKGRKSDRGRSPLGSPIGQRDGRHHRRSPRLRHRNPDSRQSSRSPRRRHRSPRRRESPDQKRHTRHGERRHESRDHHRPRHLSDDEQQPSPKRRRVAAHAVDGREAQPMEQGSILRGTIQSVKGFGCFVELDGQRRHALVHHSQVSEELVFGKDDEDADKVAAMEYFCRPGSRVWIKITEIGSGDRGDRISGSMKVVDQESGKDLDPSGALAKQHWGQSGRNLSEEPPSKGSVHKARIVSIRAFGAFVELEGYRTNGLVHVSQISDNLGFSREDPDEEKVAVLSEIIKVDEIVYVKVTEVRDAEPGSSRGPKIGCSIKLVSQRDGADLDPNNLKFRPRQADGPGFGARAPVGANAGQVQQGAIDWGHLNADKVNMDPRNNDFDLVTSGDEGGEPIPPGNDFLPPPPKKGLKKQRKIQNSGAISVEEAMAIVDKHKKKTAKKKDKKKHKKSKSKKGKRSRNTSSSSSEG